MSKQGLIFVLKQRDLIYKIAEKPVSLCRHIANVLRVGVYVWGGGKDIH